MGLGAASMLCDVGQRFLHDAIGVTTQRARCASGTVDPHLEIDLCAGAASLLHQAWNVSQGRLRHRRRPLLPRLLPCLVAQHPNHVAQLLQRLVGRQPQQGGTLAHLGWRQVACDLERTGMQRHQGDAVGQHVVHLPRDAGSLSQTGPFGADELIGFGPSGTVAQGGEKLTPGANEHAPCDCRGRQRGRRQHHRPGVRSPEPDRANHCGRNEQRGGEQGGPDMAVDGQRGQCEQASDRAKRGKRPQQDANECHPEGPASPPPQ